MQPGCIVRIFSAVAGYDKYHLCLTLPLDQSAGKFLFINSDPQYRDLYVVEDVELPCLPKSPSGKSCFSFSMVPRYSVEQLAVYSATVLGVIEVDMAKNIRAHAGSVTSLSKRDLDLVKDALDEIVDALSQGT